MYIRFVITKRDENSHEPQGIFQALYDMKERNQLSVEEVIVVMDILRWFDKHLHRPARFSRSRKRTSKKQAISWYKITAQEHINRMYELINILRYHNVPVRVLKTDRQGYIVYEDEFQVVSEPFRGKH